MAKPAINLERAILLVMDYQKGILVNLPTPDGLVTRMAKVIELARKAGLQVGYVRVAFTDKDYQAMPASNTRFKEMAKSRRLQDVSVEAAVDDRLAPKPGDVMVRKTRVGAFSTTDLAKQLKAKSIDTLILAGISTSGVVLSTVRDASDHDYTIYVLEDCCADPDPEVHAVLMQKVLPRQATIITSGDLLEVQ